MGEYFVFVAKDTVLASKDSTKSSADTAGKSGPGLRAFQVKVEVGQTIGGNIIIKSGLSEGDKIITDGIQSLHDGSVISASAKHASQNGSGDKSRSDSSKSNPDKN
jgi:membrane fusion protein (multidrug efflux system)